MSIPPAWKQKSNAAVFFFAGYFLFQACPDAHALQIKRVTTHKAILERGQEKVRIDLDAPVDPQKTLIFLQYKVRSPGETDPFSSRAAAYLSSQKSADVVRDKTDAVLEVQVITAEFKEGLRVHSGISHFPSDLHQKNIKLPNFDITSSVPFLGVTTPGFDQEGGEYLYFTSRFLGDATFTIARQEAKEIPPPEGAPKSLDSLKRVAMPEATVYWQVAEFKSPGVSVQSGIAKLPHFGKDTNAYLISAVKSLNSAFMVFDWLAGHGTAGSEKLSRVRGMLTDDNVLRFDRNQKGEGRGADAQLQWYVTEFDANTGHVQFGTLHFAPGESSQTVTLPARVESRRTVLMNTASPAVPEGEGMTPVWAQTQFIAELSSPDTLTVSRGEEDEKRSAAADVNWLAIEFAPLTLTRPDAAEVLFVGEKKEILWNYADELLAGEEEEALEPSVELRLSLEGGNDNFPYVLAEEVPVSAGRFVWEVPAALESENPLQKKLALKISLPHLPERNFDVSREPFEIKGVLNLLDPDGGQVWNPGDTNRLIRWTYKGYIGKLALYYDLESGFGPDPFPSTQRIAQVDPGENGSGSYLWDPVPDVSSFRSRVKIVTAADPAVFDISSQDMVIVPRVAFTSPNQGNEILKAEKPYVLQWETSGTVPRWNLYYSIGEVKEEWVLAAEGIEGGPAGAYQYEWTIPAEAVSEFVKLKIENALEPRIYDVSPDAGRGFLAVRPWIKLASPAREGEVWRVGDTEKILWDAGGTMQYLKFEYSTDNGKTWVQGAVTNAKAGQYVWTVPDRISRSVLLQLSDVKDASLYDVSAQPLEIKGVLELEAPGGGEVWNAGDLAKEIKWTSAGGLGTVSLFYDLHDGEGGYPESNLIASGLPHSQGSFQWSPLPDVNSTKVRLRVVQDSDPEVYGESLDSFSIQPSLTITAPSLELKSWFSEKNLRVQWQTSGSFAFFGLYYQTEDNPAWIPAAQDIPGGGAGDYHYDWKVPVSLVGQRVRLKVRYEGMPEVEALWNPDAGLGIHAWVEFKPSIGPIRVSPGGLYPLEWDFSGNIRFIRVESSFDGGKNWFKEAVVPAEKRTHPWTVPDRPGGRVLFRLADLNNSEIQAVSLFSLDIES